PGARMVPLPTAPLAPPAAERSAPATLEAVATAPANVLVNDKTGNAVNAAQAEQSGAMWGSYGLCAWNKGKGFVWGGDTQGAAYTTNGGATWTTISIPHPSGAVFNFWFTDPVVSVNEKTGEFWYAAISRPNGIAVVKGTFSGSTFTWGMPRLVRTDPS